MLFFFFGSNATRPHLSTWANDDHAGLCVLATKVGEGSCHRSRRPTGLIRQVEENQEIHCNVQRRSDASYDQQTDEFEYNKTHQTKRASNITDLQVTSFRGAQTPRPRRMRGCFTFRIVPAIPSFQPQPRRLRKLLPILQFLCLHHSVASIPPLAQPLDFDTL